MSHTEVVTEEVALLKRQLERERIARRTAERIGESVTADLWRTVQQLQAAEAMLRAKGEQSELSHALGRQMRRDLDPQQLMAHAVVAVGEALQVDRCLIRLADDAGIGPIIEQWSRVGVPLLPPATEPTEDLAQLIVGACARQSGLWIDDVHVDERLDLTASPTITERLGCHAYAGVPLLAGSHLVGWLVLHCTREPRTWGPRDHAVLDAVAYDLGGALMQALAHQDQVESLRKLRELDSMKSELISRVSHELRTPLSSITGYLEILAETSLGPLDEAQMKVLGIIERNCARLQTLVENLLTLSRLDANEGHQEHTAVELAQIVYHLQQALTPLLAPRDLIIDIHPVPATPGFVGDPHELERILLNLLTNAIKFTPDGGRIDLTTTWSTQGVTFVVRDTGHGISAADQIHLFRRFFRARTAIEKEIPGTGLGLSLVKAMVEAHSGTIALESAPGAGTTVTVNMPLLKAI